jgi:hypothetical protein
MNDEERKAKIAALSEHMKAVFPEPNELAGFLIGGLIKTWESQGYSDQNMVHTFAQFLGKLRSSQRIRPAIEVMPIGKRSS